MTQYYYYHFIILKYYVSRRHVLVMPTIFRLLLASQYMLESTATSNKYQSATSVVDVIYYTPVTIGLFRFFILRHIIAEVPTPA